MFHWLPYDEARLYRLLRTDRAAVRRWLRDDRRHTLGQVARRRGLEPEGLADALVPSGDPVLRQRALRTITQGHLAQHVLFHSFHQPAVALEARRIFGVSALDYRRLRLNGRSPASIGARHDRSRELVARRTMSVLRATAARGARSGAMPRVQARRLLRQQRGQLSAWLDSRIRKPGARWRGHNYRVRRLPRSRLVCFLFAGRGRPPEHQHAPATLVSNANERR